MYKQTHKIAEFRPGTKSLTGSALAAALNKAKKPQGSGALPRPQPSPSEAQKARYLARTSGGPLASMNANFKVASAIAAFRELFQ